MYLVIIAPIQYPFCIFDLLLNKSLIFNATRVKGKHLEMTVMVLAHAII